MKNITILIVDDDGDIHDLFKQYFEALGCSAEIARNGREGVAKYRDLHPDVVLMDVRMPVMNGYESSRGIKQIDPDAKIIMVTGYPDDPLAARSLQEGYVRSIIPKPFNLKVLLQTITATVAA